MTAAVIHEPTPPDIDLEAGWELDTDSEIDALVGADRHLRNVARLRAEIATLEQVYAAEITRLTERRDERIEMLQRAIDWHLAPVRQLHERLVEVDPKRKTIELPHGTLRLRVAAKPQVFIDDQEQLVAWALDSAPDVLPEVRRINVTDLRKTVDVINAGDTYKIVRRTTGEIVPHVHAEIPAPTWAADTIEGAEI